MFPCNAEVPTQQEAELDGVIEGIQFVVNIQWPVFRVVGDSAPSLEQVTGMRASSELSRHNHQVCRLFCLILRAPPSVYMERVPGDLNPANCFSRIDGDCKADFFAVASAA